jgi:putative zinc finger protein
MSQGLQHEEMQGMLPAAALEMLEGAELERLQAHLAGCPGCVQLLRQYRDAAAGLALQVPAGTLDPARSAAIRNRLMARVRAGRETRTTRGPGVDRWLGWMVAAGLAGILLVHHSVHRTVDYGWLLAGVLTFVLVGLGVYARKQQRRAAELQQRLDGSQATFRRDPTS